MHNKDIYWTPMAIESLNELAKFTKKIWNSEIVNILLELIDQRINLIKDNPKIASFTMNTKFRKIIVHKNVSLFYVEESNLISYHSACMLL